MKLPNEKIIKPDPKTGELTDFGLRYEWVPAEFEVTNYPTDSFYGYPRVWEQSALFKYPPYGAMPIDYPVEPKLELSNKVGVPMIRQKKRKPRFIGPYRPNYPLPPTFGKSKPQGSTGFGDYEVSGASSFSPIQLILLAFGIYWIYKMT